jgi:hypothetical protein
MPQFTSPRFERVVIAPQTTFNAVPNGTGTWTNTGAKLLRVPSGTRLTAPPPLIPVPWKTGTRSPQPGIVGRKSTASWSLPAMPVIPSGTGGTVPDSDLLLQGIFGQAPTSTTYTFADSAFVPFCLGRFQHGQTALTQQFGFGCLVGDASFAINGDVFTMSASGPAYWVLDSENFANEDTAGKGGLTTFPLELSSPTVVGTIQRGFVGTATFDANGMDTTTAPLISAGIRIHTGNAYVADAFGVPYPALPVGGERSVGLSATFIDTDGAALNNLKVKAKAKTLMTVTLAIGATGDTGNITTFTIKGVQLNVPDYADDNARVTVTFGESAAHPSAIGVVDELTLAFS